MDQNKTSPVYHSPSNSSCCVSVLFKVLFQTLPVKLWKVMKENSQKLIGMKYQTKTRQDKKTWIEIW